MSHVLYRTYEVAAPVASHFRPASCAEVECANHTNGWMTTVLPGTREHAMILGLRGRYAFTGPERNEDGSESFTFAPGQPCFRSAQHRARLERDPFFIVRDGGGIKPVRLNAQTWREDFAERQEYLRNLRQRG